MGNPKCAFKLKLDVRCENHARLNSDYCHQHNNLACRVCGCQATHICYENTFCDCQIPLCDSQYCITVHDLEFKHARTIWEW